MATRPIHRGQHRSQTAGILALFAALSVFMTWPLPKRMLSQVPGPPWDNLVWLYDFWWFKQSVFVQGIAPWYNALIFRPFGYHTGLSETTLASKALVLPLLLFGDEVLAYNALVLLSFFLSGLAAYLLTTDLTGRRSAGLIAGVVFAFCPYRIHALGAGWIPLLSTQWVVLSFWGLERMMRQPTRRTGFLAGLFLALTFLSSWYYLVMVGGFAALYVIARWLIVRRRRSWRSLTPAALMCVAVIAVLTLPALIPLLNSKREAITWTLRDVEKWSAGPEDFFFPNIYQPLWGAAVLRWRAWVPSYPWYAPGFDFLGYVPLALAAIGLRRGRRRFAPLAIVGVLAFILALGPTLHFAGQRVYVPVPAGVEAQFSRAMYVLTGRLALNKTPYFPLRVEGTIPIPLPGLLFYLFVPFAGGMRTFYRFGLLTTLAVAVLAGLGADRLLHRWRETTRQDVITGLLVAVVMFEFVAVPFPYGFTDVARLRNQPLDRWLAEQPPGLVMRLPLATAWNGSALYRTTINRQPAAYGHGTFYEPAYLRQAADLANFPDEAAFARLHAWGVRYLVLSTGSYDGGWSDRPGQTWAGVRAALDARPDLVFLGTFEDRPQWRDETVSGIIQGALPVNPVINDRVAVYDLLHQSDP